MDDLMNAVQYDTLTALQQRFEQVHINRDETWFDYKLLIAAFRRKHKAIINFLLDKGCRVRQDNRTNDDLTPLHYAVRLGDNAIVRKVLKNGASIFDKNSDKETPYYIALKEEKFHAIDAMLSFYNFEAFDGINDDNLVLFHMACLRGKTSILQKFLDLDFPVNIRFKLGIDKWDGYTPLHFAVKSHCANTIRLLLGKNANVFTKNAQGLTPLHVLFYDYTFPCLYNYKYIYNALIRKCVEVYENPVDNNNVSHFHVTCINSPLPTSQFYLNSGVDVNKPISSESDKLPGYYPLHIAVEYERENLVALFLKHGATVNVKSKTGLTPLHIASSKKNLKIVKLLLRFNANINIQDDEGRTPIHSAFFSTENSIIVDLLLSKIQKPRNINDSHGLSHFHVACAKANVKIVEKFLKHKVSINSCVSYKNDEFPPNEEEYPLDEESYAGFSALHFAVAFNRKDVVIMLLKHGANVNIDLGNSKIKPLHLACMYNKRKFEYLHSYHNSYQIASDDGNDQITIIKALLNHKAKVNAKDICGKTPLIYACEIDIIQNYHDDFCYSNYLQKTVSKNMITIVKILLGHGTDIHILTTSGKSLLHIICKEENLFDNFMVVRLCLSKGIDVNARDDQGLTALHVAIKVGNQKLVDILMDHNADINAVTKDLMTPLHLAIRYSCISYAENVRIPIIESLLQKNCDMNVQNAKGETPIHMAFGTKCPHIFIRYLLQYGADINTRDMQGTKILCRLYKNSTSETKQVIFNHIRKLDALGSYVNKDVRDSCLNVVSLNEENENIMKKYSEEVEMLKNVKVDNYSSLYDILLKDENEMAKHVKNETLKRIMSHEKLEDYFPTYHCFLLAQYNKGIARRAILNPAKIAFDFITNMRWPNACSERIFRYLSNQCIKNLIKAKDVKISSKRKLCHSTVETHRPTKKQSHPEALKC